MQHQFHIVNRSQLPFLASGFAMLTTFSLALFFHNSHSRSLQVWDTFLLHCAVIGIMCVMFGWFLIIIYESGRGFHTNIVQTGLRVGFWLFLVSEAMLFFSFFWGYFHYSLNPPITMGHQWPTEMGIQHINPFQIPLWNTILLLSSGVAATFAHQAILITDFNFNSKRKNNFTTALTATIVLGYIFLICQAIEYIFGLNQSWSSNVFWSIFFLLTGFHGFHVIVGTLFLQFNLNRITFFDNIRVIILNSRHITILIQHMFYSFKYHIHVRNLSYYWNQFAHYAIETNLLDPFYVENYYPAPVRPTLEVAADETFKMARSFLSELSDNKQSIEQYSMSPQQHLGFEAALYYWHFVDAVWILLYMIVYIWAN